MDIENLNYHIKNYLENDKTNSAIMLTGAWGSGKSYYIKNTLIPYIDEHNKGKCLVVSLYGVKELKDISKSLYLEIRAKKLKRKNEAMSTGKLVAKTIVKGVASHFGVDLTISDKSLQSLYESVNLTNKLIILEDLERCPIDIVELLGFVNNLVEQDGVKVLLVANENEIIQYESRETKDSNGQVKKVFFHTPKTEDYLRKKEKTVSDTLYFEATKEVALKNIINLHFKKDIADDLIEDECICNIINVLNTVKSNNLRSVMFACQKTSDMINRYNKPLNGDFIKFLLCGNIAFSCRIKNGEDCTWKDNTTSPTALGTATFPLYKVCYDFIQHQCFIKLLLEQAEQTYLKRKKIDNSKTDYNKHFDILRYFYNSTEEKVSNAIIQIKRLLSKNEGVEYSQYGMLANYLIAVRDCIDNNTDIDECKSFMLANIRGIGNIDDVESDILYHSGIELEDPVKKQELADFKKSLIAEINFKKKEIFVFDSSMENVEKFINYVHKNCAEYINAGSFAKNIPIDKFIEAIKACSSKLIAEIRGVFLSVYSSSNIKDFLSNDKEALITLKGEIQQLKDVYNGFDKIQRKQLDWFISNLEDIIYKLS